MVLAYLQWYCDHTAVDKNSVCTVVRINPRVRVCANSDTVSQIISCNLRAVKSNIKSVDSFSTEISLDSCN